MPKIEVNEKLFFNLLGTKYDYETLEDRLTCGKAELDEKPDNSLPEDQRVIKIELNDTNRPDLWSTAGVARQLRLHKGESLPNYSSFMSKAGVLVDCGNRVVTVDSKLKDVRPYMIAFVISGKPIDEPMLLDIIQTQENCVGTLDVKDAQFLWVYIDPQKYSGQFITKQLTQTKLLLFHFSVKSL